MLLYPRSLISWLSCSFSSCLHPGLPQREQLWVSYLLGLVASCHFPLFILLLALFIIVAFVTMLSTVPWRPGQGVFLLQVI